MLSILCILSSSSVIAFDLGTTNMKTGVFRAGRSIEIVLNEQSKRKTPAMVSFEPQIPITVENVRNISRRVGISANPVLIRNSSSVIRQITEVIGKQWSPELQAYLNERYLDFVMNKDTVNGIEPEIALAMLFEQAVQHAKVQLQQDNIQDAVVAVPGFFTDSQKKKVSAAIKLAGLKLTKIIDEKTALSLQYAIDKHDTFVSKPKYVAIIDFGASSLTLSSFKFHTKVNPQARGNNKKVPIIEDLDYSWSDIGGFDFDIQIARYLKDKYQLPQVDQTLLADAERIKLALTLTDNANVSVDSLQRRIIFTKDEFLEICGPLLEKIEKIIFDFKQRQKVPLDSVEIVGGSNRIPAVLKIINKVFGMEISRSLNSDEAIVCGATFTATSISGSFRTSDVVHQYLLPYNLTIIIGNRRIQFVPKKNIEKQTVKLDPQDDDEFSIEYDGNLSPGTEKLIGKWKFEKVEAKSEARILFNLAFTKSSRIKISNAIIATKNGEKVEKKQLQLTRIFPEKSSKLRFDDAKRLMSAFTANDIRLSKIAEARNSYETALYNARENLQSDETWSVIVSEEEKKKLTDHIKNAVSWIDSGAQAETSDEITQRRAELDQIIVPIQDRVSEFKLLPIAVNKLEAIAKDVNTSVNKVWPLQGLGAPRILRNSLLESMNEAFEAVEEIREAQKNKKPWEEQPAKTTEIELRIRKLQDQFENVKNNLKQESELSDDDVASDNEL
ncbi:dnaK protein [Trichomonas vaginalis G3]|uniref:DnaK protein n=1 Tax=Trichomonas vaginalis (strain ATCC PRA-98 / G3) TaxID=412133 RepID=A2FVJ6_TRIV3|nr:ATP binding [Trichomonas vaginalis G3]EAX91073.1 dnaK protein [Trichomonas vaginalis G3]KAI5534181.1 ATP binding [Trichomonas vaginalis G3]|eukprot:XP_001304003.1 dnaK protein [Trichomonas vaginalis G3]